MDAWVVGGIYQSRVFLSVFLPSLTLGAVVQRHTGARRVKSFPPSAPIQPFGIARIWHWSHICQRLKPAWLLIANLILSGPLLAGTPAIWAMHGWATSKTRQQQPPVSALKGVKLCVGKITSMLCKYFIHFNNGVLKWMHQKLIIINTNIYGQENVRVLDPWCTVTEVLCCRIKALPHVLLEVFTARCMPSAPTSSSPLFLTLLHLSKAEIIWQGFINLFRSQASFAQQRPQSSIWHWFLLIYVEQAVWGVHVHWAWCSSGVLCLPWQWYGLWWNMEANQHN